RGPLRRGTARGVRPADGGLARTHTRAGRGAAVTAARHRVRRPPRAHPGVAAASGRVGRIAVDPGGCGGRDGTAGARRAAAGVRRRVRLRTRLRQARQAWRRRLRPPVWTDLQPRVTRTGEHTEIVVGTAGALRHRLDGSSRSVRVVVKDWCPPWPGWSGRVQPLPGLRDERVVLPRGRRGRATVAVTLAEPLPLARIAAAVHPVFEPLRPPPVDGTARATPAAVTVDATAASPRGRQAYGPRLPVGELRIDRGGWRVVRVPDGRVLVAGRVGAPLVEPQREALARLGAVVWTPGGGGQAWPGAGGTEPGAGETEPAARETEPAARETGPAA